MRFSLLPVIVLLMPILEIAGFIVVGKAIGLWPTLALIILTSMLGLIILRNGDKKEKVIPESAEDDYLLRQLKRIP